MRFRVRALQLARFEWGLQALLQWLSGAAPFQAFLKDTAKKAARPM